METGKIDLVPLPEKGLRPYGIKIDHRGRPWTAPFGTHRLASIDPDSMRTRIRFIEKESDFYQLARSLEYHMHLGCKESVKSYGGEV